MKYACRLALLLCASAALFAQQPVPIVLTPASLTLVVGETGALAASAPVKSWSVNDTTIAALTGAGLVKGIAPGTAVVTAKGGPYIAQALVTVTAPPTFPDTLVVTCPSNLSVVSTDGLPVAVTYTATTTGGVAPVPPPTFTPPSGSLFAAGSWSVFVHATSSDGQTSDCSFTVTAVFVDVTVVAPPTNVDLG